MADETVANFPRTAPALLTDLLGGSRSPFAAGDDLKLTIQDIHDSVSALVAGATLTTADILQVLQTASAKKVSLSDLLTFVATFQTTMLNLNGSAFTIVGGSSNSTTNGTNLVNAYAAAKLATPQGAALSINNRFTIFLLPGVFTVTGGALVMDTEFIDIVGLSTATGSVVWDASGLAGVGLGDTVISSTGNTLGISAPSNSNVTVMNVSLVTSAAGSLAFNPSVAGNKIRLINSVVLNSSAQTNPAMAQNVTFGGYYENVRCWNLGSFANRSSGTANASGTFVNCKAGDLAFGWSTSDGTNGNASGLFIDCEADGGSFGRNNASGTFIRCRFVNISGTGAGMFGGGTTAGDASGTFILCVGNANPCFGAFNASGTFRYCSSGQAAFGCNGTANGTFEYCTCVGTSGTNSFGAGTSSGTFLHCEVTGATGIGFGASATASGTYEHCRTGSHGFAGFSSTGGTFSGTARWCSCGGHGFGSGGTTAGTMSGVLIGCAMTGHMRITLTGKIENMRIESVAANTTALQIGAGSTGAIYGSTIVGTGSGLSIDVISGTPTIKIAHCRLNKSIGASVTNAISTPYNVDDTNVI